MAQTNPHTDNEATYESLISLIENSQHQLAPIIVACDDRALQYQIIQRYEAEARQAKIQPYRIELGEEPSVRAGLAQLKANDPYLQKGGEAVFTVTGADLLLRVHLRAGETGQTQLDKFYGYLQWTREGLREFRYPIVLWVTYRILQEMSQRAPDFWSWRKAVLRFANETPVPSVVGDPDRTFRPSDPEPDEEFLPPLEELQQLISQLEATDPESSNLATFYDRLGQVYAKRIRQGEAADLEQERQLAIAAFQKAIDRHQKLGNKSAQMNSLRHLGNFLNDQSQFNEAIVCHQHALELARELGDRHGEAASLNNLGIAYNSLGQYQRAIGFLQQSLKIKREIGDRFREANSLANLSKAYGSLGQYQQAISFLQQTLEIMRETGDRSGEAIALAGLSTAYNALGQYQRAIDFIQQALEINREIGDRSGEAISLHGLGNIYCSLGQYKRAIDLYQQSLEIKWQIGDHLGKADSLFGIGIALTKVDRRFEARRSYEQALEIYTKLGIDDWADQCKTAIYHLQQIVSPDPLRAPRIGD